MLINIFVEPEENVYPMVAPGKGINEMVGVKKNERNHHFNRYEQTGVLEPDYQFIYEKKL